MENRKCHKVLLVEPSELVSAGVVSILESSGDFCVENVLPSLANAPYALGKYDIVVVNPSVVGFNSIENIRDCFVGGKVRVVLLLHEHCPDRIAGLYDGCIGIYDTQSRILKTLRDSMSSEGGQEAESMELSQREKEIVAAVARGLTNKEIADECSISVHTVMTHRRNISAKLGINTISGLTVYAVINRLIDID